MLPMLVPSRLLVRVLTGLGLLGLLLSPPPALATLPDTAVRAHLAAARVPFVANEGQVDARVAYYASTFAGRVYVTRKGEIVYSLPAAAEGSRYSSGPGAGVAREGTRAGWSLTETPVAGRARVAAKQRAAAQVNYFIGNDAGRWRKGIATYESVELGEVWPGVRLSLRAHGDNMEKVFTVLPGAQSSHIRMRVAGARSLKINKAGALVASTGTGEVTFTAPVAYQEVDGLRRAVPVAYRLDEREYGFALAAFDPNRPLVIDPLLQSTFVGGSGSDLARALAIHPTTGDVYVAGYTASTTFPGTAGGAQPSAGGGTSDDVFVTRLNSTLTTLLQSTFLGGSGTDQPLALAIHPTTGDVYVAGETSSTAFPGTGGGAQPVFGGNPADAFVTRLNSTLTALLQSTFLGGNSFDEAFALAIHPTTGNVYVGGVTTSTTFPGTAGGAQPSGGTGFVSRLNSALTGVVQSTLVGGSGFDCDVFALAIHPATGDVYVAGRTGSSTFPGTAGGAQGVFGGGQFDAFVTRFNSALTSLLRSTLLGAGGDFEWAWALAIHPTTGDVYVAGKTDSTTFPGTAGGAQAISAGGTDAFVTRFNSTLTALLQSTFLGGSATTDEAYALAIHPTTGNVYVSGLTALTTFPGTAGGAQAAAGGGGDAFVTRFNSTLTALLQSTFLGGSSGDAPVALAIHPATGDVYVAGNTGSSPFPGSTGGAQPTYGGGGADAFVARLSSDLAGNGGVSSVVSVPIVLSSAGLNGSFFTSELALTNRGTTDATILYTYTAAFGGSSGTAPDSLAAGRQKTVPDAITYLRALGIPLGDSGNRGGTLRVSFSGLSSADAAAATVRTTTVVPEGRAGLAYAGLRPQTLVSGAVYICGLRQNLFDRSNVALINTGSTAEGGITLRPTVVSGDPANPLSLTLPDIPLAPGGFTQISGILASNGLNLINGYVKVERVSGTAPFYVYGVINDQANSDGSFVEPVPASPSAAITGATLQVVVETSTFSTELVVTNFSGNARTLRCTYVASALSGGQAVFNLTLLPNEQQILPAFVQILRSRGVVSGGPGPTFTGALFVSDASGDLRGVSIGARTSAVGGGGRYGLFYSAVPAGAEPTSVAWLYGLQQNADNRTNLALVNVGSIDSGADTFHVDLYDGATGQKAGETDVTVAAKAFFQIGTILAAFAPGVTSGYARVTRTSGNNPFVTYAVINDGGQPGQRSGDGAFVSAALPGP